MKKKYSFQILTIIVIISVAGVVASQLRWLDVAWELSYEREQHRINLAIHKSADQLIMLQNAQLPDTLPANKRKEYIARLLNTSTVDSVLQNNMQALGLTQPYSFALVTEESGHIIAGTHDAEQLKTNPDFLVSLSSNVKPYPLLLLVNMDIRPGIILNRIKLWLLVSLILIGVIFTSFIRTVIFLRKEKRITREKMDFVKNLIHEYKTPIATINMASDILIKEHRESQDNKLMRYLGIIRDENLRLRQLVEKLMGMAVIDRAELTLSQEQVDLHHLIRRATEIMSLQFEQANAKVEINLMADSSMIYADPVHIVHVLTNILDNAMKYSDLDPQVYISTDNDSKNKIHMEICDNGVGIPPEQQKQIFNQFYRGAQHVKQGKSGFGLGLYYVKTMIEQHDGRVHIQSVPEQGTCFSVFLPIIN